MQDTPNEPMSAENVEEFEVLISESRDLEVAVISLRAPWTFEMENYEISLQWTFNESAPRSQKMIRILAPRRVVV